MKKKFQLLLSSVLLALILLGYFLFTTVSKDFISYGLKKQMLADNQVIGEEVLSFLYDFLQNSESGDLVNSLQDICNKIQLPNGGFVCVIHENGDLIAAPGLDTMKVKNLMIESIIDFQTKRETSFSSIGTLEPFLGTLNYGGMRSDIVASLPIGITDMRLNIHQNIEGVDTRVKVYTKKMTWFSIVLAIFISGLGYFLVTYIVNSYESKIEKQKDIIAEKNKNLMDSIHYASYLQKAYLPNRNRLGDHLPDSFIFEQPKEYVSGDFFWVNSVKDKVFFAAIDCTGHGVPGSLLSMISYGMLEHALLEKKLYKPSQLLNYLCTKFPEALSKKGDEAYTDGMDLVLCCYDLKTKELSFSGAKNPLILIRNSELTNFATNRFSIGSNPDDSKECYTEESFTVQEGDLIYLFSDGYIDQFGGPYGKKFKMKAFRELLLRISPLSITEQQFEIKNTIREWIGDYEQIDDILVMGVRFSQV